MRERLAARNRLSTKAGREGIAPDRLLRCCVLKHLKSWSFRDLERELRGSLVYRKFTRFDDDATPTYSAVNKLFKVLGSKVTRAIHECVVAQAREERIAPGRMLRTDTTVVETNVHYPTDSSLLGDGIHVLTRHLARIATECDAGAVKVVDHARAVKYAACSPIFRCRGTPAGGGRASLASPTLTLRGAALGDCSAHHLEF